MSETGREREMDRYTAEITEQKLYEDWQWAEQFGSDETKDRTRRRYERHLARTSR